jgi:hypothetical protein
MPRLSLLCAALLAVLCLPLAAADRPPNILMIVSDDHAWNDYGFMGSKSVSTPHLDKLAAESRLFPRGYVTNSLCGPSLASMLTGRHVHRHGLTGNDPFFVLADFADYLRAQDAVSEAWRDRPRWNRMSLLNSARTGFFSSDRAIRDYAERIWGAAPFPVTISCEID